MPASDTPQDDPAWRRWPLPAPLIWGLAWLVFLAAQRGVGAAPAVAFLLALAVGGCGACAVERPLRRLAVLAGFPASALALGGMGAAPAWLWLPPLALLVYPLRAWRDAPLFPTPVHALDTLAPRCAAALPRRSCSRRATSTRVCHRCRAVR